MTDQTKDTTTAEQLARLCFMEPIRQQFLTDASTEDERFKQIYERTIQANTEAINKHTAYLQQELASLRAENAKLKAEFASQAWTDDAAANRNKHAFELMRLIPEMNDFQRQIADKDKEIERLREDYNQESKLSAHRTAQLEAAESKVAVLVEALIEAVESHSFCPTCGFNTRTIGHSSNCTISKALTDTQPLVAEYRNGIIQEGIDALKAKQEGAKKEIMSPAVSSSVVMSFYNAIAALQSLKNLENNRE